MKEVKAVILPTTQSATTPEPRQSLRLKMKAEVLKGKPTKKSKMLGDSRLLQAPVLILFQQEIWLMKK
jgi:hypothetical protein